MEGARRSLRRLRGAGYPGVEIELEEIQQCCEDEKAQGNSSVLDEIRSRTFVIPMAIFTLIFILLGCTGNDTMVFLGPSIFSEVDVGLPAEVLTILPWIGFSLGYAISTPVMAKMNRVTQFVTFSSLMAASLVCLGAMLHLTSQGNNNPGVQAALLGSLLVTRYVFNFLFCC